MDQNFDDFSEMDATLSSFKESDIFPDGNDNPSSSGDSRPEIKEETRKKPERRPEKRRKEEPIVSKKTVEDRRVTFKSVMSEATYLRLKMYSIVNRRKICDILEEGVLNVMKGFDMEKAFAETMKQD